MKSPQIKHIKLFIDFAKKYLKLPSLPHIHFVGSTENKKNAFGHAINNDIYIRLTERHPIDIMRTIAHELIHYKQKLGGIHKAEIKKEDEANAIAGRLMREFDTTYPEVFKDKAIKANMLEDEGGGMTTSAMAVNNVSSGNIAKYDPILGTLKRKPPQELLKDRTDDMKKEGQNVGKNPNPLNNTFGNGNTSMRKGSLENLRDMFDKHRERVSSKKRLRDITRTTGR